VDANFMKIRTTISIFFLLVATLLSLKSYGQDPVNLKTSEQARADSIRMVDQEMQRQGTRDKYRMDNAKNANREST
jgi:hypothetical protein